MGILAVIRTDWIPVSLNAPKLTKIGKKRQQDSKIDFSRAKRAGLVAMDSIPSVFLRIPG